MAYRIQTLQVMLACMKELQIFAYESTRKGDYHRKLDPNWSYTPTYLRKMHHIRRFLSGLPKETRIIGAGCCESVLVELLFLYRRVICRPPARFGWLHNLLVLEYFAVPSPSMLNLF